MVNVNELKGCNLQDRYYDPTQPFVIENEFYRFSSEPNNGGGLKYEFQSDYYNAEVSTSSLSVFEAHDECFNNMLINEFRVDLIKDVFSSYENIDFIDLYFDLNELPDEMRFLNYYDNDDYEELFSYYKSVLEEYGISCNDDDLNYVVYLVNSSDLNQDALCDSYDLNLLLNENIENTDNIRFKLAYILYLQLVSCS